jgi:hypothetical protein
MSASRMPSRFADSLDTLRSSSTPTIESHWFPSFTVWTDRVLRGEEARLDPLTDHRDGRRIHEVRAANPPPSPRRRFITRK